MKQPGVTRDNRISEEGLERLENQLKRQAKINPMVLKQWIKRYGDPAKQLLIKYNQYNKLL